MNIARAFWGTAMLAALVIAGTGCSRKPSPEQSLAWNAEIQRLKTEQDSLRARAAALLEKDTSVQNVPKGEVVIAVPTTFLRSVIGRVFSDVVDNVTLSLSGIKVHVAKSVKKVVKVGEFTVDVEITKLIGKLHPGQPEMKFGENRVTMALPVRVSEGHGEATIHFVWDGKHIADVACGDMDITQKVSGSVIPSDYVVAGTLSLGIQGKKLVGTLTFPETKLRIRVKPSKESWDAINAILEEKGGVCGWVLDKVDVPNLLTNLVEEKGFNVKLPLGKIKPFILPAGVRDSVEVGGRILPFATQTNTIRIDPDAIWYSANVALEPEVR